MRSWQLFYLKAPFFSSIVLYNGIFFLNLSSKIMKGYIIIFFVVSVFLTITSLIILTVEDKEDQRTIGSVVGAIAAFAHIYYLVDNYGLDWIPWFMQKRYQQLDLICTYQSDFLYIDWKIKWLFCIFTFEENLMLKII